MAQVASLIKEGYLFFQNGDYLHIHPTFVEKENVSDWRKLLTEGTFDPQKDSGLILNLYFLCKEQRNKCRAVLKHSISPPELFMPVWGFADDGTAIPDKIPFSVCYVRLTFERSITNFTYLDRGTIETKLFLGERMLLAVSEDAPWEWGDVIDIECL